MLNIQAIKSNKGYYIKDITQSNYYSSNILRYLFDGVKPEPTFHKDWFSINDIPVKVSHMEKRPNINYRYILTDDSLQSDKIPAILMKDDVVISTDCEGHTQWKPEYAFYKSLYVEVSDEQPDEEVEDEFEFNIYLEIGDITEPSKFVYPTGTVYERYAKDSRRETAVTQESIIHQDLDRIIFPSLLIHETPCKLSSEDVYKIVRNHILTHINSAVAGVHSNYGFCFDVYKKIPLATPYETTFTDSRKRRGSKNRVVHKMVTDREVKIFEMTHSGRGGNYQGYTPIHGIEARNEQELKENIDTYLNELMDYINEPVKDCPTCAGRGVVIREIETGLK